MPPTNQQTLTEVYMAATQYSGRSIYEERYKMYWHSPDDRFTCFYCGVPAETVDHVPPLSRVDDYEAMCLVHERYVKVPCCKECNMLAGSTVQESIIQRKELVADKLAKRHASDIRAPEWDKEELASLTGRLRGYVAAAGRRQKRALDRINYYAGVDAYIAEFQEEECEG